MKYKLVIDDKKEESILIYAHQKTELICEIEELIKSYEIK